MINKAKFKELIIQAETGDENAMGAVVEVLRPRKEDTVEEIYEKIVFFQRLFFNKSFGFKDAEYHKEINFTTAEQIHSYLNFGRAKWKGVIIVGFRESAKTTKVKFGEIYMAVYLSSIIDAISIVSESASGSDQFTMDIYNILSVSKVTKYFGEIIKTNREGQEKKESQKMSKFSTIQGVTYTAKAARITKRGDVKVDIDEEGEVETKRPKKIIFDDVENEVTIRSFAITDQIYRVMGASIDGMDQILGSWVLLGNYLSLRGNIAKFLRKYRDNDTVKIINIPIMDSAGNPTWADKYVRTNAEASELLKQGINKVSIEELQKSSDNFETEFMNNPSRSMVYFSDELIKYIDTERLVQEDKRDDNGWLVIEEPDKNGVYAVFVDASKGNGGDPVGLVVVRLDGIRFREVANLSANDITPEDLAPRSVNIATKYNNALIIPENNYPGNEYIAFLLPLYNNIFKVEIKKDNNGKPVYEYGVNTNLKTKPEMALKAKGILKDELLEVRSQHLYNQISEYPDTDVHAINKRDGGGGHFDTLMALMVGLYKVSHISKDTANDEMIDRMLKRQVDNIFNESADYR